MPTLRSYRLPGVLAFLALILVLVPQGDRQAEAAVVVTTETDSRTHIPAFSRKYGVSCTLCHSPAPRLNEFGGRFAENGFEFMVGEVPLDTIDTGDASLRLMREVPLAIRLDVYGQLLTSPEGAQVSTDLQTPWLVKVLSGGQIAPRISYYVYFFMSERGEVAGLEDAYVQFTDIGGSGVNILAGQFQVSDPLFKRELRLQYEDYQAYRVRVGDARADLTYDRGLMITRSPWEGADASVQIVSGRGLDHATSARQYDTDGGKNLAFHLAQAMGPVRLGAFGYLGREEVDGRRDNIRVWGSEATVALGGNLELNAQYLRRTDDNPFFAASPTEKVVVDGGFGELIWTPDGPAGRWAFTGLYNRIQSSAPVFTVRAGEVGLLDRYETAAIGANFLLWRNVRLTGETMWNFESEQARFVVGAMTAF